MKKNLIFIISLTLSIFLGILISADFTFAESCPSNTTVHGTTVTFVGEVTDMGGDSTVDAWFEYGETNSYGQTTPKKTMSQTGIYCITVSGLKPCTTYHYRAVAKNSAGISYGENKTFTTACGPSVDIKANGSDGPIYVSYGNQVTLTWTSTNANSCVASGDWSGTKSLSGSQTIYNLTSSKTFTLNCTGSAGSNSDSVTVNVGSPSLSVSLSAIPSSGCAPLSGVDLKAEVSGNINSSITYFFDCTNDGTWEKIITSYSNPYIAYNLCSFGSTGNYLAKVKVENQGVSTESTTNINVYSCYSSPTVDLKVNGADGAVTIPYNTSATLTWTSTNANSCVASGDWSGTKSLSGSQNTGNLTSSKSYILTCSGAGGSNSDSVTVNVESAPTLKVKKFVRNLSDGTNFGKSVYADPLEVISFSIEVSAGNNSLEDVIVKDTLPDKIIYRQDSLKIDGNSISGDIFAGLNIGSLAANQKKVITFDANIDSEDKFNYGNTQLINSVIAYNKNTSHSDTAKIVVTKKEVAGATSISTGLTNNLLIDSFLIPFAIAFFLIWLFKSKIIKFEQWVDNKKREYQTYKSDKVLKLKTRKIKLEESLKKTI